MVLMYHQISDKQSNVLDSCQHTVEEFKSSIFSVIKEGYEIVSIDEALNIISKHDSRKFAVVTFDDVPISAYEIAFPLLKQYNIPFTFFITTDYIGKNGYLSESQILELDRCHLCTIGSHTISHPMLRNVNNSFEELVGSKSYLEKLLGHEVRYLAYPYGRPSSVSSKVIKSAKQAGYKCAFGTIDSLLSGCSARNIYYLPRIVRH